MFLTLIGEVFSPPAFLKDRGIGSGASPFAMDALLLEKLRPPPPPMDDLRLSAACAAVAAAAAWVWSKPVEPFSAIMLDLLRRPSNLFAALATVEIFFSSSNILTFLRRSFSSFPRCLISESFRESLVLLTARHFSIEMADSKIDRNVLCWIGICT